MGTIYKNGVAYGGGGGSGVSGKDITLAQYNLLSDAEKKNGDYYIVDADVYPSVASEIGFSDSSMEATNVHDAITTLNTNLQQLLSLGVNKKTITIWGAARENIETPEGNVLCTTDERGITTLDVRVGDTYTLVGSLTGYSKTMTITQDSTLFKVMPDGATYWYGNKCGGTITYAYPNTNTITENLNSISIINKGNTGWSRTVPDAHTIGYFRALGYTRAHIKCRINSLHSTYGSFALGWSTHDGVTATNVTVTKTTGKIIVVDAALPTDTTYDDQYVAACDGYQNFNADYFAIWVD